MVHNASARDQDSSVEQPAAPADPGLGIAELYRVLHVYRNYLAKLPFLFADDTRAKQQAEKEIRFKQLKDEIEKLPRGLWISSQINWNKKWL